jgi:superfamily II DNA helicase RecQ
LSLLVGTTDTNIVIHLFVSLFDLVTTDYIQETGRGGRDGNQCTCILYYRDQDTAVAKRVLGASGQHPEKILRLESVRTVSTTMI